MAVRSKRGIVLITTMISVVLVVMLVSSVVYSSMGGMRLSSAFAQREAALMAATSGAHYAMTRLQSDPTWVGAPDLDAEGKPAMPQLEGIEVSEYQGNVVGKLQTSDGRPLFFRIKFNYEDGEGGFDRLPNTAGSHTIGMPMDNSLQTATRWPSWSMSAAPTRSPRLRPSCWWRAWPVTPYKI